MKKKLVLLFALLFFALSPTVIAAEPADTGIVSLWDSISDWLEGLLDHFQGEAPTEGDSEDEPLPNIYGGVDPSG